MRGKKRIPAILMPVILGMSLGDCTGNDVCGTRDGCGSSCGGRKGTYTGRVREKSRRGCLQYGDPVEWLEGTGRRDRAHTGKRRS